ncbi:MAG: HAMP domain-containing histidine kinase [Eggerthellaceae bacterium]|nr:HAMP domain-containing histidine kinase [Eggerthellaceae bacterium]
MSDRTWLAFMLAVFTTFAVAIVVFAGMFAYKGELGWLDLVIAAIVSSLVGGTLLYLFTKRFIMKPADYLASGMKRIAHGDFDTTLDVEKGRLIKGVLADFNDMSESLLQVEALHESFVSNVSHEFKTPLAYIQGYATLLQDNDLSPAKRKDYSEHINSATRRLSNMIGNLLEISNLSRPSAELPTAVFSLDEQLRHVMAIFIPQIEGKELEYDVEFDPIDIEGNESLLENVWTNLFSNAVKYTPRGGKIGVTLRRDGGEAVVVVSDTGCGMTANQAAHAFDRFYQGEDSHVSDGSGLGLAIVKTVVKKHGGVVDVESKLGHGSTFTVRLPIEQPAPIG